MNNLMIITSGLFWLLLVFYSVLTISGILFRSKPNNFKPLDHYPSVSIFIPAHNEGKVVAATLDTMVKLEYPGELTIYLLNDNSKDETGEIAEFYANTFPRIKHIKVPPGKPSGKSRVLNHGLSISNSEYIAVYDADNQPEPDALKLLVERAVQVPDAVGAVGYVWTLNESRNWLTRMIALEFKVFQLLMQSGRWIMFNTGSLTGTNMLVSREVMLRHGGWDPYALAEDADLTMTITAAGGLLPIVPESRTWEQEPETFRVWLKQRTRWMEGNIYIILKSFRTKEWFTGRTLVHSIQQLFVYIGFVFLLIVSDIWFFMGLFGHAQTDITTPLLILWFQSYLVYLMQLLSALTVDRAVTPANIFIAVIMYFTYAQLFMVLLVRALYFQIKRFLTKAEVIWDKTVRF
ncbi:glycosyltransferase family 2 protein [Paenibacillus sp. Soil787]|uniref:glycosyltransferase family 2 protein n=1 Tax=Paenibacillus sp. Soil787 TaxID=1736411 RepID=UPI0006FAE3DF|nr:glycosyltransferase [Paenibacillus sp. Soil787]KRF43959.1 N-acetylglucosaminyltransferase [Paenibacillus sp. Soil787]